MCMPSISIYICFLLCAIHPTPKGVGFSHIFVNHKWKPRYTERRRGKEREGEGRRRSCHEGERGKRAKYGSPLFPCLLMRMGSGNAGGCAVLPSSLSWGEKWHSQPRFLLPDGNPLPVLSLLSCARNVPFCSAFRCRFSGLRSLALLLFPSFRSSLLLSFFLLSAFFHLLVFFFFQGEGRSVIPFAVGKEWRRKGDIRLSFWLFSRRGEGKRNAFFLLLEKAKGNAFFLSVSW